MASGSASRPKLNPFSAAYSNKANKVEMLCDDEDDSGGVKQGSFTPTAGGPFSALTPSMWPQDLLAKLTSLPEDSHGQPDFRYDEFGFRVEEEDGPEESSSKLLSTPFVEDPQHRLKWTAHLEFTHNHEVASLTWDKIQPHLLRSDKLKQMVRQGIPHSLRPQMWFRLSGAWEKKNTAKNTYSDIVKASGSDQMLHSRQIEKDLLRTLPTHACFSSIGSNGIPRLRRILRAVAWLYPDVGYCQGMGVIAGQLLLFMEEEDVFWMMCAVVEDLLPASYYSSTLIGVQADQRVLREFITSHVPPVDQVLKDHDIEISLITLHWFLTLLASVVHIKVLLRLWDLLFYQGSHVLFSFTLAMLDLKTEELTVLDNSAAIFNLLSNTPAAMQDPDLLIQRAGEVGGSLTEVTVETQRKRHLAQLMAEHGAIVNPDAVKNLPKQQLSKRQLKKSRSLFSLLWTGWEEALESGKAKNVQQTELLVDLREAILQVARHFHALDPSVKVLMCADYTARSHSSDLETFLSVSRSRRRRAKALIDFERHDDDELGFRRNDIITIVSMRDEHCWVGELNGLQGWFPAKFVALLDERSKDYSSAGDDSVSEMITDLVRGTFGPALKAILEHGLKRSSLLGGPAHPWLFIEEAAGKEVERDFASVYSRLVLCRTFRLDEDGKVLTPEEILYRAVQSVNVTHDAAHAQMDVKLRSLICIGLNEQVLHMWLETLASSAEAVEKWYHPWSFLRSPGWVQIKCELRLLQKLPFQLDPRLEIRTTETEKVALRREVSLMLVKHHLFSWELS